MLDSWCTTCVVLRLTMWQSLREKLLLLLAMNLFFVTKDAFQLFTFPKHPYSRASSQSQAFGIGNLIIWYYIVLLYYMILHKSLSKKLGRCWTNQILQNGTLRKFNIHMCDPCYVSTILMQIMFGSLYPSS